LEIDMNVGFIGVGSMGGMLVRTLLRSGVLAPVDVWAANRSKGKLDALAIHSPGIHAASSSQVAANSNLILVCVAAEDIAGVLEQMDAELRPEQLLVTTTPAVRLKALEDRVPCRVATLIPSITQEIGRGVALLIYGSRVTTEDRRLLENLMAHVSQPIAITEALARPTIGLASGGPALFAYILQSMAEEAVRSNPELSPGLAWKLVQETAAATTRLFSEANMTTEETIRRVAVPGGMTALAIEVLSRYVPQAWRAVFRETAGREMKAFEPLVL
jgi:competence protein ComER